MHHPRRAAVSTIAPTARLIRGQPEVHAHEHARGRFDIGLLSLAGLVVAAPFERPLVDVPGGFVLTTVEAVICLALPLACVAIWRRHARLARPLPVMIPGVVFLLALAAAALAAPIEQGNALKLVARLTIAGIVFLVTASIVDSVDKARALLAAFVATGSAVAAIALIEAAQVDAVASWLTTFRPGFHVVGGQLRATSTLMYPTIASMYLEMAFAMGLWLLLDERGSRRQRAVAFLGLAVVAAGISATFTRAGLAGMAAAVGLMAAVCRARRPLGEARLGTLAALAAVVTGTVFVLHSPELLAARLSTEGSQAWYGARYQVPGTLRLQTGATREVPITVTNTGRLRWDSGREPAFRLAYHWLLTGSGAVVQFDGPRTDFATPVDPGATATVPVSVTAPGEPGQYTLVWDVVHETRAWLSTEGVTPARTVVQVDGPRTAAVATVMPRLPQTDPRPTRPQLWRAAVRIAAERPVFGIGPDNFRHVYGRYAGVSTWDTRVHANNMYLEVLAGAGVAGLLALLWLVSSTGLALVDRLRRATPDEIAPAVAMLAAWLMVAGHGFVDSFLSFTTTYLTFAVAAGLAFSRAFTTYPSHPAHATHPAHPSHRLYAHRL